jgi:hypothetical protein
MDCVLAHMYIYVFLCECNGHRKIGRQSPSGKPTDLRGERLCAARGKRLCATRKVRAFMRVVRDDAEWRIYG